MDCDTTKPALTSASSSGRISLRVIYLDKEAGSFSIKAAGKLGRLFSAFASQANLDLNLLRFHNEDGERLSPNDTPEKRGMTNGDAIEVYTEKIGGTQSNF